MPNNVVSSLGGSSLVLYSQQTSFDVRKESDVIALLKIVHQNPLDVEIKNHLRDLIFAYRQVKNDAGMKALRDAFASLGVQVAATDENATPLPSVTPMQSDKKSGFGILRPAPTFKTVHVEQAVQKEITPSVTAVIRAVPTIELSTPPVIPIPAPVQTVYANPNQRINEIKSIVNQKVGNPVNLIASHNDTGREYMNALLDAMKKANGGEQGGVATSMDRLEKAFIAVQGTLTVDATQHANPIATSPVAPIVVEVQKETIVPVLQEVEQPRILEVKSVSKAVEAPLEQIELVKTTIPMQAPTSVSAPTQAPRVSAAVEKPLLHSVASDKELQDLRRATHEKNMEQSVEAEKKRIAMLDPLQTPAVTSGLSQLLSEWSLFKSSGIFGTGPSGKDHVLYQKLAPLTMAAVIAGRFEGVTPQIKQSITDYMNGWRYEEEIVHDHQETFEHYLRRVIFHILNKNKQGVR